MSLSLHTAESNNRLQPLEECSIKNDISSAHYLAWLRDLLAQVTMKNSFEISVMLSSPKLKICKWNQALLRTETNIIVEAAKP